MRGAHRSSIHPSTHPSIHPALLQQQVPLWLWLLLNGCERRARCHTISIIHPSMQRLLLLARRTALLLPLLLLLLVSIRLHAHA